ncbi:MAG: EAL domain-containing protein [Pseudomonadota bacterium]|nr:EAL domain-containing protein [Pseudomonadota bacterium]
MSTEATGRISSQLSRGTLIIMLALTTIVVGGLLWATQRSDTVSVERQVRVARHSIDIALDELALQQETVAVWDNSALEMTRDKLDHQWLFDNVGSWLNRIFQHDEAYLIDGFDRPVQAVVDGKRVSTDRYWQLHKDLDLLVHSIRGDIRNAGRHDRLANHPLNPRTTVRTTERAEHDTHFMLIDGRPAAASAMLIKPSTPGYVTPRGNWPLLISVRYLDGSFLKELESRYLIARPRFSRTDNPSASEQSVLLETEWGDRLGYLIWTPELPGSQIMSTLLPINAAAVTLLGLLMLMLTRRLDHSLKERAALQARASHLAFHDALTGLPNRTLLNERLHEALGDQQGRNSVALLLIDLDRFKQVNDTLGHLAGDQLIREFATRLVGIADELDTVARLGGDEFAVVLCDPHWPKGAEAKCVAILELLARPFDLMQNRVFGGASIGAAHVGDSVTDATELMRRADVALYRAKAEGRGCARIFEPSMDDGAKRRTRLESELRGALEAGELAVWQQPQVNRSGEVVGRELLLRWNHPALGLVSPEQIIPLAEETGLILPIGDWILERAAAVARAAPGEFIAVNLSPVQLRDCSFAGRLIESFRRAGANPARVELEITEQMLLDDNPIIRSSLAKLRCAGFRIALDDFGTGYSSLGYLRRFEVDKIKIDRSFVADIHRSEDARAIIAAIVSLGRALQLTIAAEGVETAQQAEILGVTGCDQLQGYYFGVPTPLIEPAADQAAA